TVQQSKYHSSPTRRSSDLLKNAIVAVTGINDEKFQADFTGQDIQAELCEFKPYTGVVVENQKSFRVVNNDEEVVKVEVKKEGDRSEEHTSELKSPDHHVCS